MQRIFFAMAVLAMSFSIPLHALPLEDQTPTGGLFDDCRPGPTTLCLGGGRFAVDVEWRGFSGETGPGRTAPATSGASGVFWFFDADRWDLLVKVLDGCAFNEHFWIFSTTTSNFEYTLRIRDTVTGTERSYYNPPGHTPAALMDTRALATCSPDTPPGMSFVRLDALDGTRPALAPRRKGGIMKTDPQGFCHSGPTGLCLNRSRFLAEVEWRDAAGRTGRGKSASVGSDASGPFWFFHPGNWEMLVQVSDGCALNERFWVYAAAATDVEYTLRVTDTQTGTVRQYFNPLGNAGTAVTDTEAFATCPEIDPEILLFANPSVLPVLDTSQLTILVRDQEGLPLGEGQRIRLLADMGSIDPELVVTDINGEARATFTAGPQAGESSVTAVVEGGAPTSVSLTIRDASASLVLTTDTTTVE